MGYCNRNRNLFALYYARVDSNCSVDNVDNDLRNSFHVQHTFPRATTFYGREEAATHQSHEEEGSHLQLRPR